MKVYAVVQDYDEGGIDVSGIFTSRRAAEVLVALKAAADGYSGYEVAEYDVSNAVDANLRDRLIAEAVKRRAYEAERKEQERIRLAKRTPEQVASDERSAKLWAEMNRKMNALLYSTYSHDRFTIPSAKMFETIQESDLKGATDVDVE